MSTTNLSYPIGFFQEPTIYSDTLIAEWIKVLEELPEKLRKTIENFSEEDFLVSYRPNGWTVRQVIHHLADSHTNSFIRFKLALTEDNPIIKPYDEKKWATLIDGNDAPQEWSLAILENVHKKWVLLLKNLTSQQLERTYFHPEAKKEYALKTVLALYAWHSLHHLSHIRNVGIALKK